MCKRYMLIIHKILFLMLLLLVCYVGLCNRDSCRINDDVEYLETFSLVELYSGDKSVVLPTVYMDYNIPDINSIAAGSGKIGKELNICPPVALVVDSVVHDDDKSSCTIKVDENVLDGM